jgi:hypothetical protein
MALEEGSEDVVSVVDVNSSSVDEFILSPPDSEIITEDINELQKRDLTSQAIKNTLPSPQTAKVTSVAELIAFTLPTMAIWLCDPILSLLDTAMVGLTSTIELAAITFCILSAYFIKNRIYIHIYLLLHRNVEVCVLK